MIDPSIITQGAIAAQEQQQRNLAALQDFGGSIGQLFLGRRVAQMRQLGTPEEQQQFANKSIYSRQLNTQRKTDTAEALKIRQANEDRQFEVQKRNIAQQKMTDSALAAAIGGNPSATNFMLGQLRSTGRIDEPTYNSYQQYLTANANNPGAISELVRGLTANAAEKPEQYLMPDANNANTNQTSITNNVLDNTTSEGNNIRTVSASIQNNDADNQTSLTNNELTNSTSAVNNANTVNATMRGQTITADTAIQKAKIAGQTKGRETIAQQNERVATGIRLSQAASEAARASKAALDLSNHPGIKWGTGWTAASGIVPSTDAKAFRTDLENLKSQLFLPTIQQMRGMGALSNAEGAKVEAAVQNLDPSVGEVEMKRRLRLVEQGMSRLAQMSAKESKLYSQSGRSTQPQQQAAQGTGGRTMSVADAKRAAAMAKISYADAVKSLAAQGITVK